MKSKVPLMLLSGWIVVVAVVLIASTVAIARQTAFLLTLG